MFEEKIPYMASDKNLVPYMHGTIKVSNGDELAWGSITSYYSSNIDTGLICRAVGALVLFFLQSNDQRVHFLGIFFWKDSSDEAAVVTYFVFFWYTAWIQMLVGPKKNAVAKIKWAQCLFLSFLSFPPFESFFPIKSCYLCRS